MTQIQLRFFAALRERLGTAEETLMLPSEVQTLGQLRALLRTRGEVWEQALAADRAVRMAQNQEMAQADTVILPNAEIAFFPPVTGG